MTTVIKRYPFFLAFWFLLSSPALGQYKILDDPEAVKLTRQAIDSVYNLNFAAADILIAQLDKKLGDYPGVLLLKAFYASWKFRPIKKEHQAFVDFEKLLSRSIAVCDSMLLKNPDDVEASFFKLSAHAYLAQLYTDNGMNMKALGEAKTSYHYIKVGFEMLDRNPEFNFPCGIYNYYREKYPEENSFYKSFVWFFRSGDKEQGLAMLKTGAEKSIFANAECNTYLFHIYLRYEDKPQNAIYYAQLLKKKYPQNLIFLANYIENSMRLNQYAGLLPSIERLLASENIHYRYLGEIFYGCYAEMVEKNYQKAIEHYKSADKLGAVNNSREPHFDSILYYDMGRCYKKMGLTELADASLKQSIKSAEYKIYRTPAEKLLRE